MKDSTSRGQESQRDLYHYNDNLSSETLLAGNNRTVQKRNAASGLSASQIAQRKQSETEQEIQLKNDPISRFHTLKAEDAKVTPIQKKPDVSTKNNSTGLPDNLKSGVENLSGYSMDDVQVHYNSDKPSQMQAHAYAQGTDIHVAPGQEKHLPHEAWHVVQQKQGRVQPTMQMKGELKVNDDKGLEKEADQMGERAMQLKTDSNRSSLITNSKATESYVQRKINFSGFGDSLYLDKVHLALQKAFKDNEGTLRGIHKSKYDDLLLAISEREWVSTLVNLNYSPIDYGEVNLENPQHVIQLSYYMCNYLGEKYFSQKEKERVLRTKQKEKEERWHKEKAEKIGSLTRGHDDKVYETALLGMGSSIAYYLTVNGRNLDPNDTVLIGNEQPWDPHTEKTRAMGYINHPMHMISPLRTKSGISDEESFVGNDQKLSDEIKDVINRYIWHKVNATITNVSKDGSWYKITTSEGFYYAKKVISGLGIGPHTMPKNPDKERMNEATNRTHVMDMDEFHRQLRAPRSLVNREKEAGKITIGLSGPNAGVDVAKSATENGFNVHWMVSSGGPAIVEGMANAIRNKDNIILYFAYLNGWEDGGGGKIKLNIGETKAENKKSDFSTWRISENKAVNVDFLVIAQGPDISQVSKLFSPEIAGNLKVKTDPNKHFDSPAVHNFSRHEDSSSKMNIDNSISVYIKQKIGNENSTKWSRLFLYFLRNTHQILGYYTFKLEKKDRNPVMELTDGDSLKVIGGAAHRMRVARNFPDSAKEVDRTPVSATLPPTDIIDDQLTPIRSQMEAMGNFMPGYIGSSESNFATDDQTMIAAQIASYYSNIPPVLADWITQKIIEERRDPKLGVKPGTDKGGPQFQKRWADKLEALHNLYGPGPHWL